MRYIMFYVFSYINNEFENIMKLVKCNKLVKLGIFEKIGQQFQKLNMIDKIIKMICN